MKSHRINGKTLNQWLKILGWSGGTIHQVEKEINDELYIVNKLTMIEGLKPYDQVWIGQSEAKLIAIQNNHKLPREGKAVVHSRQVGIRSTLIGKHRGAYYISII